MAVNYIAANGQDLDDVFDPYVTGTSPAATGFILSSGVDLNTRYAPLFFGSSASATGLQISNGNDLNTLFAAKGTAAYLDNPWNRDFLDVVNPPQTAELLFTFKPNGEFTVFRRGTGSTVTDTWLLGGGGSGYQIQATKVSGDVTAIRNDMPTFQTINVDRVLRFTSDATGETSGNYSITIRSISDPSLTTSGNLIARLEVRV